MNQLERALSIKDEWFTLPYSIETVEEWYNKWKGLLHNEPYYCFDLTAGQDSRILLSFYRDNDVFTYWNVYDVKISTGDKIDSVIAPLLIKRVDNSNLHRIDWNKPHSDLRKRIVGTFSDYTRGKNWLNNKDQLIEKLEYHIKKGYITNDERYLVPYLDPMLLRMHYDEEDGMNKYLLKKYCHDLLDIPFATVPEKCYYLTL